VGASAWGARSPEIGAGDRVQVTLPAAAGDPPVRVLTTFATWCEACRADLPQFTRLRAVFSASQVGLFGLPVDPEDTSDKLDRWSATHQPPYVMLRDAPREELNTAGSLLAKRLGQRALPSSLVVDRAGNVLAAMFGVPTVSDLRSLGAGTPPPR
jgi:peroxiredoxin